MATAVEIPFRCDHLRHQYAYEHAADAGNEVRPEI